ncbi:hypothetical protein Forpe1208_v015745 [Fusarium oxysporum f. sp. rapae]|uniref:Uncharacterized protein n=1 Tax=Fusarium oxysporum f. sp. rapae TaxID=485398 RepID=A0A8J5NM73_FUSOX|nr:hypothetical protein Forpe1208_v015745 [Fusarium oxysporum f. sp. rapae]
MEVLQALPMIDPSHLVKSWMTEGDSTCSPNADTEANINPIFADSVGIASQALQDYPALLPYLATELHFHIEFAKRQGWSMLRTALLDKLENKTTWSRFVALKEEDSHKGTRPIENLICPAGRGPSFQNTRQTRKDYMSSAEKYGIVGHFEDLICPENEETSLQNPRNSAGGRKRPRSIASFSSAGSFSHANSKRQ